MPAAPSRIGFITSEFRVITAGPNGAVSALYGNKARDTAEPLVTYFDSTDDAQSVADERLAILQVQRSLVPVSIDQVDPAADLDFDLILPTVRIIDDEQDRNSPALVVGLTIDMNTDRSLLETWG